MDRIIAHRDRMRDLGQKTVIRSLEAERAVGLSLRQLKDATNTKAGSAEDDFFALRALDLADATRS